MSQDNIVAIEKLDLTEISNKTKPPKVTSCEEKISRSKSENVIQTKRINRKIQKNNEEKINKTIYRRRSLTMSDIRRKMLPPKRAPLKKDSCTTDNSPRISNEQSAEKMLTIRQRELQIRVLSKIFYNLWKKEKNRAENCKHEVIQLQLQRSFLINLRDKESERREDITRIAEKQKSELIDLYEKLSQTIEEREMFQNLYQKLQYEYNRSLEFIKEENIYFDNICSENHRIIIKRKEIDDSIDNHFTTLRKALNTVAEVDGNVQKHLKTLNIVGEEWQKSMINVENLTDTKKVLEQKVQSFQESERKLKQTIKELYKSIDNITGRNVDLRSQVKNLQLQLENTEQELNEKKLYLNPWSNLMYKAARYSMYLLFQMGLLPVFR